MTKNFDRIPATHLFLVLWKAFRSIEAVDQASLKALGFDNLSDFAVLEILRAKGPLPVNDIGRRVLLSSGSISTAVDRLERRSLVRRARCPEDRRVVRVDLTDEGDKLIECAFDAHQDRLEQAFSPLSQPERATLLELLKKAGYHAKSLLP